MAARGLDLASSEVKQSAANKVFHGTPSRCALGAREHRR